MKKGRSMKERPLVVYSGSELLSDYASHLENLV